MVAIAALACLALLPIYHRQYDTRILLLTFPAAAYLLADTRRRIWGALGLMLLAVATVLTSHQVHSRLLIPRIAAIQASSPVRTLLLYRPIENSTLVLSLYFLAALWLAMRSQQGEGSASEVTLVNAKQLPEG